MTDEKTNTNTITQTILELAEMYAKEMAKSETANLEAFYEKKIEQLRDEYNKKLEWFIRFKNLIKDNILANDYNYDNVYEKRFAIFAWHNGVGDEELYQALLSLFSANELKKLEGEFKKEEK